MIVLDAILHSAIEPAFRLLPKRMATEQARVLLLAITLQEADGIYRAQHGGGPAHGLWQFEEGGGVAGVLRHPMSREWARAVCYSQGVSPVTTAVWTKLPYDDVLAAAFARLLLWTSFLPLPETDDMRGGWNYYLGLWRPGKPKPSKWPRAHRAARSQILTTRSKV